MADLPDVHMYAPPVSPLPAPEGPEADIAPPAPVDVTVLVPLSLLRELSIAGEATPCRPCGYSRPTCVDCGTCSACGLHFDRCRLAPLIAEGERALAKART